jgi:hypothetical protein
VLGKLRREDVAVEAADDRLQLGPDVLGEHVFEAARPV